MGNNLDKDIEKTIERLKEDIDFNKNRTTIVCFREDVENVLTELERYKRIANMKLDDKEEIINNLCEHRCLLKTDMEEELETYKKIVEKLAEYITITDINEDVICDSVPEEICEQRAIGDCKQCIIDWARKEVENEN